MELVKAGGAKTPNSTPTNNYVGIYDLHIPTIDCYGVVVSCPDIGHRSGDVVDMWLKRLMQKLTCIILGYTLHFG